MIIAIFLAAATLAANTGDDYLTLLKQHLSIVAVQPKVFDLAGHYANPGKTLRSRTIALGGRDLYLFPDGTYIYTEWTDIMPETVFDRGHWSASDGVLKLVSGPAITWKTTNEKQYVIVHHQRLEGRPFLLGIDFHVGYLEQHLGDDADFSFMVASLEFAGPLSESGFQATRLEILRRAWNPKFFKNE